MASTEFDTDFPAGLRVADLRPEDAPAGAALSAEIGWNQTADDWRFMIGQGPGWICREESGATVATGLTLPQGKRFAWIAMVLVAESWRRRGIAGALMRRAIEVTRTAGLIAGLDATPAGRTVYGPLGFQDIYGIMRYRAERVSFDGAVSVAGVRALKEADLPGAAALDLPAFGADRRDLLVDLRRRAPSLARITPAGDGYCLGRPGRTATQIGPVVAPDTVTAMALIGAALENLSGPVLIDVPDRHTDLASWLARCGFSVERPYMRMLLDHADPLDQPERLFAIAGPELG